MLVKDKVNSIARRIALRAGFDSAPGFDFSDAYNPRSVMFYEMACAAWEEIFGDRPDLEAEYNDDL